MKENFVVVRERDNYTGGIGYDGFLLRQLGFPKGPYIEASAKILVNQLKSISSDKFKIVSYVKK
jgi:hypothetical protein